MKQNKNSLNMFDWLSIIFVGAILIFGFSFLKEKVIDRINIPSDNVRINIKILPLRGFVPNQEDKSMSMHFSTPYGMVEDEEAARENGVYKIYRSDNAGKVDPESIICISFA